MRTAGHRTLQTARLVLEPLAVEHAAEMVDVLADESLYTFTGGSPPSQRELIERYTRQVAGSGRKDEAWHNWVIRSDGRAVGFVQATVPRTRAGWRADVAWLVGAADQGRGFAREAATAMVRHLADAGVSAIQAHIADGHLASQAVARHLGMQPTDTIDDNGERLWSGALT